MIEMRMKIMISIDEYKDNSKENVIIKSNFCHQSLIAKHISDSLIISSMLFIVIFYYFESLNSV
jgi:hypothetical protein